MERIDLFRAYFTTESKYYADKLEKFECGRKLSFNPWAGLFGIMWFCYRKLYIESLFIFVLSYIFSFLVALQLSLFCSDLQTIKDWTNVISWFFSFIILGFLGNRLYLRKSVKVVETFISKHKMENMDDVAAQELREKGGTSYTATAICILVLVVILALTQ